MIPLDTSIVSGVALSQFNGQTKMLLMKRSKGNYWCHVAGHIEGDEKAWQAMVREFKEETQIEVTQLYNGQILEQFFEANSNVMQVIPVFVVICPPNQAVVLNHEHTDYRWVGIEEAQSMVPFPNQREVYQHVWQHFVLAHPHPLYAVDI
ncbi:MULTISPECIES: NUDIX hydrolase [unclassified Agarivorans]|uniref:NUDIX hydrolase n=1 Tax=unclassified Agarivorans TaxID=2636026 RepID=UPI0026E2AEBE|nr:MULTISPECIES: NUDIX domain-containing protein [unclassified Agarivorans]MDO6683902.1 NUDIX domain-containing protein [Agarivorans sp. 3_MG-2023]MDO6714365.1 NUDIX domain-containing protein [Agarivorans sp. 2_MG-2023]MDO6762404.1 NUDIX domain-containing protein [Agarivorans sp. 1_MG-2023]